MSQNYKALKENFVSNLSGGDIHEVSLVTTIAPVAVLLWSILQSRHGIFAQYGALAFAVDFLLNVVAILSAITLYSGAPILLNILLMIPGFVLYSYPQPTKGRKSAWISAQPQNGVHRIAKPDQQILLRTMPFITAYRGTMMIVTCIAILAVDFRIFPRRFAKVENWGTSLMDMGVGSFVFSAGIVAARPILKAQKTGTTKGLQSRLFASIRHSLPLLVLGLVRLYSVKGLDYAEHVTEYGVHWNFFFTLALLPPSVALFHSFFAVIPSYAILALILGSSYQALLELTSLKAYVLTAPRTDLLSKNREGVFSFFGYLAIFLAGQATGMYVLRQNARDMESSTSASSARKYLLARLVSWSIVWSGLLFLTLSYRYGLALRVSRRLANLPYILWVCAFNCTQILAFCLIETLVFPGVHRAMDDIKARRETQRATSRILGSYNRNGLALFLLANLLTGLVNLTVKTIDMSTAEAMAILLGYAMILTTVALALDAKDISIKV